MYLDVDDNGRAKVFLLDKRKWVQRYAVDARELIRAGVASVKGPTEKVTRGEETKDICPEEVASYEADGWKLVQRAQTSQRPLNEAVSAPPRPPERVDFHRFDLFRLRLWADRERVPEAESLTREEAIAALERINFVPPLAELSEIAGNEAIDTYRGALMDSASACPEDSLFTIDEVLDALKRGEFTAPAAVATPAVPVGDDDAVPTGEDTE